MMTPEQFREESRTKALKALAGYKFWMFGYHAANWVNANKMCKESMSNPFVSLVSGARQILGE